MRLLPWRRSLGAALAVVVCLVSPGPQAWAGVARAAASAKGPAAGSPAVLPVLSFSPGLSSVQGSNLDTSKTWTVVAPPGLSGSAVGQVPAAPLPGALPAAPAATVASAPRAAAPRSSLETLAADAETLRRSASEAEAESVLARLFSGGTRGIAAELVAPSAAASLGPPALAKPRPDGVVAAAAALPAPQRPAEDFNPRAIATMFLTRTVSITGFVLTSIAFPFVAAPVVGWGLYGTLMALGPLVAIATGPLNGTLADRLSARNAMALNVALRTVFSLALPAFAWLGVLNFWTLLASSVANSWVLSSNMTTENTYIRRFVGSGAGSRRRLEAVNALASVHYVGMQVLLGLFIGIGAVVDHVGPLAAFIASSAAHGLLILPTLWFMMPNDAPQARRGPAGPGLRKALGRFLRGYWREALLLAAGVGAYAFLGSPLPVAGALFYWVLRTRTARDLRSGALREIAPREEEIAARLAELEGSGAGSAEIDALQREARVYRRRQLKGLFYQACQTVLTSPFQNFALPLIAATLMGASGKALLLGKLMGAVFFGNLISNSTQARLPEVRIPWLGRSVSGQRLVQGAVLAMAAVWVFTALAPGSLPTALAAVGLAAGLMRGMRHVTHRGWIKFLGLGLAAVWLPYLVWAGMLPLISVQTALFLSMLVFGMFAGPASVSFSTYIQTSTRSADLGKIFGVGSSFFNTFNSLGYGLLTLAAGCCNPVFPALLLPIGAAYAAAAVLFWRAPKDLPGLPESVLRRED